MTHRNAFEASGSSPSVDFTIRDEGSILLLTPHTGPARYWIDQVWSLGKTKRPPTRTRDSSGGD
jgi:hypothetical protein